MTIGIAFAQDKNQAKKQVDQMNEKITTISKENALSEEQKQKITIIFDKLNVEVAKLKSNPTSETDVTTKMQALSKEAYGKVHKEILSPAQRDALKVYKETH